MARASDRPLRRPWGFLVSLVLVGCGSGSAAMTPSAPTTAIDRSTRPGTISTPSSGAHVTVPGATKPAATAFPGGGQAPVPARLLDSLRSCSIPTAVQVQQALAAGGSSPSQLTATYVPPSPPPYGSNYLTQKSSCTYAPAGDSGVSFAISWFTDPAILPKFGTKLPGVPMTPVRPLPPGALEAFTEFSARNVLYPGIWIEWNDQSTPGLNDKIQTRVYGCLTSRC